MELPVKEPEGLLFTLKDVAYTPTTPTMKQPFTVKGKVELFKLPFVAPIWVVAKVTYPEKWWEEIIPIIGSPTVGEGDTALGGDFEISFDKGFDREGEFTLEVEVYAGPTFTVDKMTLPPFPPVASEKTTFIVAGELPPEEAGFREFRIVAYSKDGTPGETETKVTPPSVLDLELGDRCRVYVAGQHRNGAVTGKYHASIWQATLLDPHDEVLSRDKALSIEQTTDWERFEDYIDIPITSAIEPGIYGLYVKIMGITGGDIFTKYWGDVIRIAGGEVKELFDITSVTVDSRATSNKVTATDFDFINTVPMETTDVLKVNFNLKWIGPKKGVTIQARAGHKGYVPWDFVPKTSYKSVTVTLPEATESAPYTSSLTKAIEIPLTNCGDLDDGAVEIKVGDYISQIWNVYSTKKEEMETLEVNIDPPGAGYVTVSPSPAGGTQHNWLFAYGTEVTVTAHPNPGYIFERWSGEMTDTTAITAPVYPMTEKRTITAHFKKEEVELELLEVKIDPVGSGYVTVTPTPETGGQHYWYFKHDTQAYVTAHPYADYEFVSWSGEMTDTTAITAPVYPMTEKRTITAHFKRKEVVPPPTDLVTFTVKGDGFPFLTSYWILYHYGVDGRIWQDYTQHRPGDIITIRDVTSAGKLSCYCCSAVTGEWSEQFYSQEFAAEEGRDYKYDIASGIVYYR